MNKFVKFLVLAVVAVLTFSVVSCKEEDPLGGELAGTWRVVKADGIDVDAKYATYLQFRTNHVLYTIEQNDTLDGASVVRTTYSRTGTEIYVKTESGDIFVGIEKLTSKELIIKGREGEHRVLVRVPDSEVAKYLRSAN